jgi:GNAT superfamily N-acetyltransferase
VRIVGWPLPDAPERLVAQVQAMCDEAWPGPSQSPMHDPALRPWLMVLVVGDEALASLAILSKKIVHGGRGYHAAGLSSVVTRQNARGHGHGHRLAGAAREKMAGEFDLGIFTCDRPLQQFYERAGWQHLPGTALDGGTPEAPLSSDEPGFDKVTMADFFTTTANEHRDDFIGSRVALFPGSIDRLW